MTILSSRQPSDRAEIRPRSVETVRDAPWSTASGSTDVLVGNLTLNGSARTPVPPGKSARLGQACHVTRVVLLAKRNSDPHRIDRTGCAHGREIGIDSAAVHDHGKESNG